MEPWKGRSDAKDIVRAKRIDWDGLAAGDVDNEICHDDKDIIDSTRRYQLITGTPPYSPLDCFVASENHEQKVQCLVHACGGAVNYIQVDPRLLID